MPLPASLAKALAKKTISDGPSGTTTIPTKGQLTNEPSGPSTFDRTPKQASIYNGKPADYAKGKK
ncbi:MAG: hypothetical protein HXX17_07925 [Geobacteraceae bacterium]|nr:hypothetical protein [Geobacteraceae bacterium]